MDPSGSEEPSQAGTLSDVMTTDGCLSTIKSGSPSDIKEGAKPDIDSIVKDIFIGEYFMEHLYIT